MSFTCERCGRTLEENPIISSEPIKEDTDAIEYSLFCSYCARYFGTCYMCIHAEECEFQNSNDPMPKVTNKVFKQLTPMGEQILMMEIPNPERIQKFCIEGKCKCVTKINEEYSCCKLSGILTCKNYEEWRKKMTIEKLEFAMTEAIKANDRFRKNVIAGMVDACRKAAITPKGRKEITEDLVNETLLKYSKMTKEMIDTCPQSREELLASYKKQYEIVMEYAPKLITEPAEIKDIIVNALYIEDCNFELTKANRGQFMRIVMPYLKGRVDMTIANKVIEFLLK